MDTQGYTKQDKIEVMKNIIADIEKCIGIIEKDENARLSEVLYAVFRGVKPLTLSTPFPRTPNGVRTHPCSPHSTKPCTPNGVQDPSSLITIHCSLSVGRP